jgi:hypothetical protein
MIFNVASYLVIYGVVIFTMDRLDPNGSLLNGQPVSKQLRDIYRLPTFRNVKR